MFTVPIDDLTDVEASDVFVNRICVGSGNITAGAGVFAHTQLFNPADSGVLAIPVVVVVSSATAQVVELRTHDTAIATLRAEVGFRDRRLNGSPAAEIRDAATAAVGSTVALFRIPASESISIPLDFILDEGNGIVIIAGTAQTDIQGNWYWTEEDRR